MSLLEVTARMIAEHAHCPDGNKAAGTLPEISLGRRTSSRPTYRAKSESPCTPEASVTPHSTWTAPQSHARDYRLDLDVLLQAVFAQFASDSGLLEATEGSRRIEHVVTVDPDRSRLQPFRN